MSRRSREAQGEDGAAGDRSAGVAQQLVRNGAAGNDGIPPVIEGDHLWEQLRAETMAVAADPVDEHELLAHDAYLRSASTAEQSRWRS